MIYGVLFHVSFLPVPLCSTQKGGVLLPFPDRKVPDRPYSSVARSVSHLPKPHRGQSFPLRATPWPSPLFRKPMGSYSCLLYTSDAADEEDSVDLGGRRIIKKKKKKIKNKIQ